MRESNRVGAAAAWFFRLLPLAGVIWSVSGVPDLCKAATGTRVRFSTAYESWNQEATALDEITNYVSLSVPIGRSMRLDMLAGHAVVDGDELGDVSGFLNSKARLSFSPGTRWAFRVGVNAPTGVTDLSDEELNVARVLSDRLRGYRGYKLGEGTGIDLGAAYSFDLGPTTVGVGAGYLIRGEYDVSEGTRNYDPGDQATVSLGLDLGNPRWLWRLDGIHVRYQADELGGEQSFRVGPRYEVRSSLTYRGEQSTVRVAFQTIQIGRDELSGTEGLAAEEENSNPKEYYLQAAVSRMFTRRFSLLLFGGGRIFQKAENGEGGAQRTDLGLGTSLRLSRAMTMTARVGYSQAILKLEEGDEDLDGLLATITLDARL